MINVTEYLRSKGNYSRDMIKNFLRSERIKYFIGHEKKVVTVKGKYGYTLFSEDLFELYLSWSDKKFIPLLNRKEYEIESFIASYFNDVEKQYKLNEFIFDWFIPSHNLLIEFNEKTHNSKFIRNKDKIKHSAIKNLKLFIINEDSAMQDLALLSKTYK